MTEDNNPSIETKKISVLLGLNFCIPDYQRGYRWTESQVTTLLDDINEFDDKNASRWYCLQPIVVCEKEDNNFVVLDGQQRLTTTYIILKYLRLNPQELYALKYETRAKSADFLKNIKENIDHVSDNIDFHHIQNAYNTTHEWFTSKNIDENTFRKKLLEHTQVIWYKVDTDEPIKVFKRLNSGKIRLTNAELIKALFLSKENKNSLYDENQLLIASEWDTIENKLNNENFWYFFNTEKKSREKYATKIDRLFEIYYDLQNDSSQEKDEFKIFNYFYKSMKDRSIKNHWEEIKHLFDTIKEWYTNHELYHLIGFCLHYKESHESAFNLIIKKWKKAESRIKFQEEINSFIKEKIRNIELNALKYDEDYNKIHRILLLHNILTTMNKTDKTERFPFRLYANNTWSLEHIHAQNEGEIEEAYFTEWVEAHTILISQEQHKEIQPLLNELHNSTTSENKRKSFTSIYEKIKNFLYGNEDGLVNDTHVHGVQNNDQHVHGVQNMALLSGSDNSALSNRFFPAKRSKILSLEKNGSYIPICTRDVFLKAYNPTSKDFMVWNQLDRKAYFENICTTLKDYLPEQKNPTEEDK